MGLFLNPGFGSDHERCGMYASDLDHIRRQLADCGPDGFTRTQLSAALGNQRSPQELDDITSQIIASGEATLAARPSRSRYPRIKWTTS